MLFKELKKRIKKNEGFSISPYKDQLGHPTIGYGHLILPHETYLKVNKHNKAQLKEIFIQDFNRAVNDYKKFIKRKTYNKKDEELLIEMVFQMGYPRVSKFKKTLKALDTGEFNAAANEMLDSRWHKQTPARAIELSTVIRNI